ncbi:MAG: hypothetical protein BVN35_05635 [Proteobacteria bacterium ST_bin11]|nr:MAG: hypothetical protein BVN35_05635 [Proteobacteria bacterium ST_bin11]
MRLDFVIALASLYSRSESIWNSRSKELSNRIFLFSTREAANLRYFLILSGNGIKEAFLDTSPPLAQIFQRVADGQKPEPNHFCHNGLQAGGAAKRRMDIHKSQENTRQQAY